MSYFSYHNKIQNLIKQGLLTEYYFDSNYNKIGFCLVLVIDKKLYPIREHRFEDYFSLIGSLYTTKKVAGSYQTTFLKN